MVSVSEKGMYLINSPAGSGKTTSIKALIREIVSEDTNSKVLCITYTNRAVDELKEGMELKNIEIKTIHSFIDTFFSIYFKEEKVIDLYIEMYKNRIEERINNTQGKDHIRESNDKYKMEFGGLNIDVVRANLRQLYYNEMPFSSLYNGGLSHDDLLEFSYYIFDRFPKVRERLRRSYTHIFVDEYQDTSSQVLEILSRSVEESENMLILFGDKMQQIYKNYDGSFETKLLLFDTSNKLLTNYRSNKIYYNALNNIYNDEDYNQTAYNSSDYDTTYLPRLCISENLERTIDEEKALQNKSFVLFLSNKKRFESIQSLNLYNAVDRMDKYRYGSKYSVINVLLDRIQSPDLFFQFMFSLRSMIIDYESRMYGKLIEEIRSDKRFKQSILDVNYHSDKIELYNRFNHVARLYTESLQFNIREFLVNLFEWDIVSEEFFKKCFREH